MGNTLPWQRPQSVQGWAVQLARFDEKGSTGHKTAGLVQGGLQLGWKRSASPNK